MAFNPFLSMSESAPSAPTEVLNPFMMSVEEEVEDKLQVGDNPFTTSNPFSDWSGAPEPVAANTAPPLDIFGGASLFSPPDRLIKPTDLKLVSADEEMESHRPPPPARPLPPETQNLIQSVTGQMEFASSHLLDRIPPTRTPSPVSVRDMQSPSPTPELDPIEQRPAEQLDINRNKPVRPPPARPAPPPPRPAPPPIPPHHHQQHEDINLFDVAPIKASQNKPTKEDILSLYSKPKKEEKPVDFLSDDLPNNLEGDCETAGQVTPMDFAEQPADHQESPFRKQEIENNMPLELHNNPFEVTSNLTFGNNESDNFANQNQDIFKSHNLFDTAEPLLTSSIESHNENNSFDTMHVDETTAELKEEPPKAQEMAWSTPEATAAEPHDQPTAALPPQAREPPARLPTADHDDDAFDAFSAKFDSTAANHGAKGAWGDDPAVDESAIGFEAEAFDPFLSMGAPPPPAATPRLHRSGSRDSTDENFTLFIRPKESDADGESQAVPTLAPPPRPQVLPESPRANPFDRAAAPEAGVSEEAASEGVGAAAAFDAATGEDDSGPPTPLFDDDISMPLEDFPRTKYIGPGWEMHLRQPNKKKITGQRFWKKVWVRLALAGDAPVLQLLKAADEREPFQELPLQACYSVSDIAAQQFDQFGKIFTVKLQYVFYKERPGVRPGQVTKAERITNKLSQFAAYAIQGDYQGVKEFGSDLRKLGLPVEHAPQVSQLFKLGSLNYEDVKQFSCCVEEALFRLPAHRDRALTYKLEEVQVTAVDELYVEQDAEGSIQKQIARVRLFFLGFLSGMPDVELGVNDLRRQGREVVGRHDIIPVVTEEWIRVEDTEFHACVQPEEFYKTQIIKFKPPDACYIELMRFRVRPPKNRELPLQLKASWCVRGTRVELRADVLVPGFASRKLGQIPCEDVSIRFPIPECWIYLFRVEKHFRYGSVKSAHRRTGKIKGIERFLGAVDTLQESLIEVTSGQAKYEHQHRAIVWRMPRLPKEGQGAYTTHNLVCRMALTSFDQVPAELAPHAVVEFTMPATQVSHTTVRSVSLQEHDGDPPEKYVRYLARHEYIVGIERTTGQEAPAYATAARVSPPAHTPAPAPATAPTPAEPSSDSDSD